MYIAKGNIKLSKECLIFSLPTSVCFGKGKQCKNCYARKAEYLWKVVEPSREANLKDTKKASFVYEMVKRIKLSKKKIFRIHESGDFYSQDYINQWVMIASLLPSVRFYGYSKKFLKFDLSELNSLSNVNIINSLADGLLNYGTIDYCLSLVKLGFILCPSGIEGHVKCMENCKLCLYVEKVCFKQH